jgi:hypothetical protein
MVVDDEADELKADGQGGGGLKGATREAEARPGSFAAVPWAVPSLGLRSLCCGWGHTLAVGYEGGSGSPEGSGGSGGSGGGGGGGVSSVYSWGWNAYGQLGTGDTLDRHCGFSEEAGQEAGAVFQDFRAMGGGSMGGGGVGGGAAGADSGPLVGTMSASAGVWQSVVVSGGGEVFMFGWDASSKQFLGPALLPVLVTSLSMVFVTQVAAGARHCVAKTSAGAVYVSGNFSVAVSEPARVAKAMGGGGGGGGGEGVGGGGGAAADGGASTSEATGNQNSHDQLVFLPVNVAGPCKADEAQLRTFEWSPDSRASVQSTEEEHDDACRKARCVGSGHWHWILA